MFFDDRVNIIDKANGLHNSVDGRIKSSVEEEHNGQLPFLDTLVTRDNGFLITSVYKPTHTDKYLDYTSHQDKNHKVSTALSLLHRQQHYLTRT